MITGVLHPDRGRVELFGAGVAEARDRLGYLPEERGLYRKMRVLDHLLFLAEIKGRSPAAMRPAAERWLRRFELWEKRDGKVEELSKGNQQKVQLAGALLFDPELVVLDEPGSGLDPVNVVLVRRLLQELAAEGKAILLSTHQMGEAEKLCDEIVLVHDGKVVKAGPLAEVKASGGRDAVHVEFEGDGAFLARAAGRRLGPGRHEPGRAAPRARRRRAGGPRRGGGAAAHPPVRGRRAVARGGLPRGGRRRAPAEVAA